MKKTSDSDEVSAKDVKFNAESGILTFKDETLSVSELEYLRYSNKNYGPHFAAGGTLLISIALIRSAQESAKTPTAIGSGGFEYLLIPVLGIPAGFIGHLFGKEIFYDWQELDLHPYKHQF